MELKAKNSWGLSDELALQDHLDWWGNEKVRPAKVNIQVENKRYILKVAESKREFHEAIQLRYTVFHCEYRDIAYHAGIDSDRFDDQADILIIKDKRSNQIVGTYRILCSDFTKDFYSQEEFTINSITNNEETKLELSRACVRKESRNGAVIHLLWKGIYQYMLATGARYLFGCSSITGLNVRQLGSIQRHLLHQGLVMLDREIYPRPQYYFDQETRIFQDAELVPDPLQLIPSLLNMYLKAGAKVALIPAWDDFYRCFDFFTLLDSKDLNPAFIKAFGS